MKNRIEATTGMKFTPRFNHILDRFEQHFGSQKDAYEEFAQEQFCHYMNIGWIDNKYAAMDDFYPPFEAELPFPTGIDGNRKGWLNLCPEIGDFKKPFILWTPMDREIWYCGKDEIEIVQNVIHHGYNNTPYYADLDFEFLKSLDVNLDQANAYTYLDTEQENSLPKLPIDIPFGYQYEMTIDGVGVLTKEEYFSKIDSHQSRKLSTEEYIKLAQLYQDQGFFGSAMFYLKEAYFRAYLRPISVELRLEILERKADLYTAMDRIAIADVVKIKIDNLNQMKNGLQLNEKYIYWDDFFHGWNWIIKLKDSIFDNTQIDQIYFKAKDAGIQVQRKEREQKPSLDFELNFPFDIDKETKIKTTMEIINAILKDT
ncbi:MAG: hypothetical protein P1U56_25190 [Saprospiraceae bacterium]|nr:hypothetical protein [Saprospiraceae bacterium]